VVGLDAEIPFLPGHRADSDPDAVHIQAAAEFWN